MIQNGNIKEFKITGIKSSQTTRDCSRDYSTNRKFVISDIPDRDSQRTSLYLYELYLIFNRFCGKVK